MPILSIQSHVTSGYVGNRAAVFPLQRLGHNVHAVNTVQFSNHTGYGKWQGQIFTPEHIRELILGMDNLGALDSCAAVLSGYMGDISIGHEILNAVSLCKKKNPNLVYLLDPVMGDVGRGLFVKPNIPEFITEKALGFADIITPNHFELEVIAGKSIQSLQELDDVCHALHKKGPRIVLCTSFKPLGKPKDILQVTVHTPEEFYIIETPDLPFAIPPNGCGDLFSAVFLGYYLNFANLKRAFTAAVCATFGILNHTYEQKSRELCLIEAQHLLVDEKQLHLFQAIPGKGH